MQIFSASLLSNCYFYLHNVFKNFYRYLLLSCREVVPLHIFSKKHYEKSFVSCLIDGRCRHEC